MNSKKKFPIVKIKSAAQSISSVSDLSGSNSPTIQNKKQTPWSLTIEQTEQEFKTSTTKGLSNEEAEARIAKYGLNQLDQGESISIIKVLMRQVCNAMVLVLLISMAISFGIKDWIAGGVISGVIGINVFVGFIQEYNAEKTMESLRSLSSPTARVIRNGTDETIPSINVVPGDLIVVKVGDTVPADLRIVDSMNFETDEALLTGESLPVSKDQSLIFPIDCGVGDRINMAYSSSIVTKGRATGICTSSGMFTEIGVIAMSLRSQNKGFRPVKRDEFGKAHKRDYVGAFVGTIKDAIGAFLGVNVGTPLQRKLAQLAIFLFGVAVIFAIVVMAAQKFKVNREVAVYAIAVALSMIPGSLVVVLTITMAVGTKVMVKRNVIVRKLDSLEALGIVSDICSDKTGTLTQGKMVGRKVWIPAVGTYQVINSTEAFNPTTGQVTFSPNTPYEDSIEDDVHQEYPQPHPKYFTEWLNSASLANIANIHCEADESGNNVWKANGDPTEIAIQVFAHRLDWQRNKWTEGENPKFTHLAEFPFDSSIKRMSAIYKENSTGHVYVFTKGAVERVLDCCSTWYGGSNPDENGVSTLTEEDTQLVFKNMNALAKQGLRVLSFSFKLYTGPKDINWKEVNRNDIEKDLHFLGLIGIYDPPRLESAGAVKMCHRAGINVHMLTGDHPGTAKSIAQEVGILPHNLYHYPEDVVKAMVMTAQQFDSLSDEEIDALPVLPLVIARCAPQTKVRMIDALHRRKAFCAMTGDGVNDSPSLKRADVGIAMGISGSDVAKDASDIVLSDDNFASILNAVEEGRRMAANIQKFVLHLLAGNVSQALFLLIGLAFQDDDGYSVFPLSPVEVLWVIMITSSFPAMGLGIEAAAPDIMDRPPVNSKAGIFTWEIIIDMMCYGVLIAIVCIFSFVVVVYGAGSGNLGENCNNKYTESCLYVFRGRSTSFLTMTWCLLLLAWEVIDLRRSVFAMHPDSETPYTQVFKDLWSNKFLFLSVVLGFASAPPLLYIPVINKIVFKHGPISWEWGISVASVILFFLGSEMYKWFKRIYFRNKEGNKIKTEEDLESATFSKFSSISKEPQEHLIMKSIQ
ncbi:uncharacterized protein SAPINGB_P001935 [Magnusiomyces paraingens]|uniref:P-type Na(+) transporter n=1 Tax=Magnusiomyces paraingens TaxID=2606893 RepID=A0A5E8BJ65_9ASCO|nr:uncharacterized protein SAPINGB_P001935 [Saprochaete ingens]VVT48755.1 unnamed protein product [Saprochaete ingens]